MLAVRGFGKSKLPKLDAAGILYPESTSAPMKRIAKKKTERKHTKWSQAEFQAIADGYAKLGNDFVKIIATEAAGANRLAGRNGAMIRSAWNRANFPHNLKTAAIATLGAARQ